MAMIEGFRVKNFGVLQDVGLGICSSHPDAESLLPMTAVIGKNGVGKSTLFDAFGFLADALRFGVEDACDSRERGGFRGLRSKGRCGPIQYEVVYLEHGNARPIIYTLDIDEDDTGRPFVSSEALWQPPNRQGSGHSLTFLIVKDGEGVVWAGEGGVDVDTGDGFGNIVSALIDHAFSDESTELEAVQLEDTRRLAIATLGSLKRHPRVAAFRRFIEDWYLSYFTPDAARDLPRAGPQMRLNVHGDNLGNVVQFMQQRHPDRFRSVLTRIADRIPGIHRIDTERTPDGRLLLRFNDRGFEDPFYARQMSDGTLKLFAYLLLLEDPAPPPFLCIEEPENGLYHKLLETLVQEFRARATGQEAGSQVFVTTHQPYLVDALDPEEVWILEKGEDGFTSIRRASDDPTIVNMVTEGLPLGGLWFSDYLDPR